ncbi:hypothetical protein ACH0B6_19345 [Solibacillus silvestris]
MAEQQLPVWNSEGIEPPVNLQIDGWQPGVKPPAQYFDWLFNRAYKCLEELQAITEALETNKANGTDLTSLSNYLTQHLDETTKHDYVQLNSSMSLSKGNTPIILSFGTKIDPSLTMNWAQGNGDFVFSKKGLYLFEISVGLIDTAFTVEINDVTSGTLLKSQKLNSDKSSITIPHIILNDGNHRVNITLTVPGTGSFTLYPDSRFSWCVVRKVV